MSENKFEDSFFKDDDNTENAKPEAESSSFDSEADRIREEDATEKADEVAFPESSSCEPEKEETAPVQQPSVTEMKTVTYVGNNAPGANQVTPGYTNLDRNQNQWQQSRPYMPDTERSVGQTNAPKPYQPYNIGNAPAQTPPVAPVQPRNQGYNGQAPAGYPVGAPNGYNPYQGQQYVPAPPKKNGGKTALVLIIIVCLALAVGGMVSGILLSDGGNDEMTSSTVASTTASGNGSDVGSDAATTQGSVAQSTTSENIEVSTTEPTTAVINSVYVAEKVRPSVVGVMEYYNGKLIGEGSGILMSEDKAKGITYVVTCAHVISDKGATFGILLLDGTPIEAEMVAYDERTDIGVLKVKKTGLPLAEFGDSSTLRIGEPVYAIGNPGGSEYFGSITNGIVASIDRSVTSTYKMTCIQHNAAINPGNSGGALVNSAGQVIGINSSKIASTEFEGMGFAVPTSIAGVVVDNLIHYGYVPNRPKLGIEYAPVSSYQLYGLVVSIKNLPQGSLVIAGISEDSSLAGTEAQVGDLIIAVNGKNMDDSSVLLDMIETGKVGDELTLTVCRIENRTYKTTTFDVTITLVEDKPSQTKPTEPATEYDDEGYYHGGSDNFDDFFNEYFGW